MKDLFYNNVGFDVAYLKQVTLQAFMDRHKHLWPDRRPEQRDKDLRAVWEKVNNSKEKGIAPRND
jgi:hypothetical protein